tara:strand:+ start:757 stop:1653 length:897 start_codon:yes stop_codon:yes gene_type:complete
MAKFGNKYFRNIGSVSNKILQRLGFYRQTPGADFTFGGKSFDNIAASGVPIYQRLPSFYPSETAESDYLSSKPLPFAEYITEKLGFEGWTINSLVTCNGTTQTTASMGSSIDDYVRTGVVGRDIPLHIYPCSLLNYDIINSMAYPGVRFDYINYTLNGVPGQIQVDQYFPIFDGTLQSVSITSDMTIVDYITARLGGYEYWEAEAIQFKSDNTWYEHQYPYDSISNANIIPMKKGYSSSAGAEVGSYNPDVVEYVRHGGVTYLLESKAGEPFNLQTMFQPTWKTVKVLVPYPLEIPII